MYSNKHTKQMKYILMALVQRISNRQSHTHTKLAYFFTSLCCGCFFVPSFSCVFLHFTFRMEYHVVCCVFLSLSLILPFSLSLSLSLCTSFVRSLNRSHSFEFFFFFLLILMALYRPYTRSHMCTHRHLAYDAYGIAQ